MNPPTKQRSTVFVAVATAFSLLGDQVLYAVLPVYYETLGITAIQVGILLALNRWVRLLTNALAHRMVQVGSQRFWFVAAFALGAATTLCYVDTRHFAVLCIARLGWGLAWSFIRHFGVQSIMTDVAVTRVGWTMGAYNGISRAGSVAGLFLGALLVDLIGYHAGLSVLAALSLCALPFALAGFRPFVDRPAEVGARAHPGLLILGLCLGVVGPGLVMSTLGATLDAQLGESALLSAATATGAILAVRYVLDSAAAPFLGAVTDRLGLRRAGCGFFGIGAVCLTAAAATSATWTLIAAVVGFFIVSTALQAGVAGAASKFGSAQYAAYVTASDLGSASGPLLGWWLVDAYGDARLALACGAALFAVAMAVSLTAPRLHRPVH